MPAPYWGELPGPKIAQTRRMSSQDDASNADRRQSLDVPPPNRKTNRASSQTANTEAPTETTFSPYDSPTAASFAPQGLAPRPASYQRAPHDQSLDYPKPRHHSRNPENFDDAASAAHNVVQDTSRGPSQTYHHPYGDGGLPYTYTATGAAAGPSSQADLEIGLSDKMDSGGYYNGPGYGVYGRRDPSDRAPENDARRESNAVPRDVIKPIQYGPSSSSNRRKKFADAHSPLKKLELTLDSMTKEEKRARVEAAERRARERLARKAAQEAAEAQAQSEARDAPEPHGMSYDEYFRSNYTAPAAAPEPEFNDPVADRQVSRDMPSVPYRDFTEPSREMPREIPVDLPYEPTQNAPVQRRTSTWHGHSVPRQPQQQPPAPEETQDYYASGAYQDPDDFEPVTQQPIEPQSGIPKRNLSFRERAARENLSHQPRPEYQPPAPADVPTRAPEPEFEPEPERSSESTPRRSFSLTRSGSNKLKKDPPGDPWYRIRAEAAQRAASFSHPVPPTEQPPKTVSTITPLPSAIKNKSLPPDPPVSVKKRTSADINAGHGPIFVPADGMQGVRRRATEPVTRLQDEEEEDFTPPVRRGLTFAEPAPQEFRRQMERTESDWSSDSSHHHRVSNMIFKRPEDMVPGNGLYKKPEWLDEWQHATVGTLAGSMLELSQDDLPASTANKAWWEEGDNRRHSLNSRPQKAEAFDGEYDENAPTRFKPQLYLKCGPLLRYCGMRHEQVPTRTPRGTAVSDRELWRGSVMIVTRDADSSYDIAPTLRLFVQDIELLPPPPQRVDGELSPEYVDPIAGHPKLGRRGETLYVRPVDHLEEAVDLSRDETDEGLFETAHNSGDGTPANGSSELPGSFASRRKRVGIDGEKAQKYKDVRGFRLHAERGYTFWRFNIEVELVDKMQRIAYRINRGPAMGFWVPARSRTMNIMFYSCNGFSMSVKPDELSGPDPMWRDVLNTHQTQPFHAMIGGGDQIYNDCVGNDSELFKEWLRLRNPLHKHTAALTPDMQDELEEFYLERYCMWFSQGLFGLANSQIPMINMYDDHDIFDGYGSYPHHDMNSPVFRGLGAVGFKYYMLFQHQSIMEETEASEPSWIIGTQPGPYIDEMSRSLFMSMGGKVALLAVDTRTERTEHDVISDKTWEKIMNRMYAEMRRGQVEHLLVLLGVPIAYPRLVWLENILTSRIMDPVKAIGKTGILGNMLNNIDGGVEVLDDLNDHWTAKNHKQERSIVVEDLQDLAIDKSLRITILSGDVHLAAVGQFYSNPKLGLAKHKDPRYMPNIISSAIVNTPPPDLMADVLNKRNKVHHFDKQTDENMIPMFHHGVDGKPRNNKHLLPHRNWCSIREWQPGTTPPPTPPQSDSERSPSPPVKRRGSLLRRLSLSKSRPPVANPQASRDSVRDSRPPVSRSGGLFRSLSRRNSVDQERPAPAKLTRSMSVGGGESGKRSGFFNFARRSSQSQNRPDDGGINGTWGDDSEEEFDWLDPDRGKHRQASGLRGGDVDYDEGDEAYFSARLPPEETGNGYTPSGIRGGGRASFDEYTEGDDSYFTAQPPRRAQTMGAQPGAGSSFPDADAPPTRPFYRTPTGLSTKQKKNAETYEVNLEGGLDISLNVEVNPKDPAGITVPYRLLVPRLLYEYNGEDEEETLVAAPVTPQRQPSGFRRLLSFRKKPERAQRASESQESFGSEDEEAYQARYEHGG